jgi:hypothetical protein
MSWEKLLADKFIKSHKADLAEITQLREIVIRDLKDARIRELSIDRRFACLYSAALQLAHMVTACNCYRVSAVSGHHKMSFAVLKLSMGKSITPFAEYFDVCRRKRNIVEYDGSSIVTETELAELQDQILKFQEIVESWIRKNYPKLSK